MKEVKLLWWTYTSTKRIPEVKHTKHIFGSFRVGDDIKEVHVGYNEGEVPEEVLSAHREKVIDVIKREYKEAGLSDDIEVTFEKNKNVDLAGVV